MAHFHRLGTWLLVVGLVSLCLPQPLRAADFEKYLLDDSDAVFTVNVKQVIESPLFAKHFRKQAEVLLQMDLVQKLLKDAGVDPFKDVERVTAVMGNSCHQVETRNNSTVTHGGPLVIVQGNFAPDRLEAWAAKLAKDQPDWLTIEKIGAATVYRVGAPESATPLFVAVLDKHTLVAAQVKPQVLDALDKAAGKKKTVLKHPALQELLPKLDGKAAASWLAIGEMIHGTSVASMSVNGLTVTTVKHTLLKDAGIDAVTGTLTVNDIFKAETMLTFKDTDKAKEMSEAIEQGVKKGIEFLEGAAAQEKKITALVEVLKGFKVTSKDKSIGLRAQGNADAVEAWITLLFLGR